MLPTFITIIVIVTVIVLWIISIQRRLVVLEENIKNAMSQIGMQLSSCFDALTALLDLTKSYAGHECETLNDTIKLRRVITAKSKPDDVLHQEGIISETLGRIVMVTEQYPELKANQTYIKTMDAVQTFENMLRTSYLIYNDSVTKLNREIRIFPVSMIATMMGFRQKDYLEEKGYIGEGASDVWKSLADKIELAPVTNYNVWVDGVQVTSANASDVLGDGKVSYTPAADGTPPILTLTGANISTAYEFDLNPFSKGMSGIYVKGDINLVLVDNNSIGGSSFDTTGAVSAGIFVSQGDLNISGTGSLISIAGKATTHSTGVNIENLNKSLTICDGANVTAIGGNGYYSRGVFVNGSLMIDGGSLTAMGDHSGDSSSSYGVYGGYLNSSFTTKNGGSLTAVGGNAKYTSAGAYFLNITNNIIVDGGTVTASAQKQAINVAPVFGGGYVHINTAGLNADGSGATVLNDSILASGIADYKYVKIEPFIRSTIPTLI
nr:LemA family protein [uncultured Anaerosporobacter sp.]